MLFVDFMGPPSFTPNSCISSYIGFYAFRHYSSVSTPREKENEEGTVYSMSSILSAKLGNVCLVPLKWPLEWYVAAFDAPPLSSTPFYNHDIVVFLHIQVLLAFVLRVSHPFRLRRYSISGFEYESVGIRNFKFECREFEWCEWNKIKIFTNRTGEGEQSKTGLKGAREIEPARQTLD